MKYTLFSLVIAATIAGCGGGDSGGSSSNSTDGGTGGSSSTSGHGLDGIYLNSTDLAILLIDTDLPTQSVFFSSFESSSSSVLINDTHSISGNTITTKGATLSFSGTYSHDANLETKIDVTDDGATMRGVINNTNFIFSFERTQGSAPLADIVGIYTNPDDASVWTINSDSTFTVVGTCLVSGTLKQVKHYYTADNVETSNCIADSLNATDYKAHIVTVEQFGIKYLLAVLTNDSVVMWGSTPLFPE
ncbi:hypothetical protein [Vibrio japonicus]|uniref:Lipoprotein n=1 Tax=Vibrio japonicus TaxID=1824638 RepID=A0ABY5LN28_9VIBR|nr:hypothetical protein [Vibrio japonicus]UUM32560.1 hypothetical protein NP165_13380 [Vibrio japonicus]